MPHLAEKGVAESVKVHHDVEKMYSLKHISGLSHESHLIVIVQPVISIWMLHSQQKTFSAVPPKYFRAQIPTCPVSPKFVRALYALLKINLLVLM